ncbi:Kunitz-type serine protease inhibitor bitisilin-2 [Fasciola gigantica]|uniref:Kunitz-type serine protease inhibitor bitisilin-2 n=1 Tax=Fasciola gigantica TaxID=46835 RepID=A0A504YHB0_FASGI|nr:Kunitz-type serine protease inhibitor bitisilin-2 [Fasciola gigantica]
MNDTMQIQCRDYVRIRLCMAPVTRGPCRGYNVRWGYDPAVNRCVPFIYGGCAGNANNHDKVEWCEHFCLEPQDAFDGDSGKPVC